MEDRRLLAVFAYDSSEAVTHDQVLQSYANGYDDQMGSVTFSNLTAPANGSLSFSTDGSFEYTPYSGFAGTDSFAFQVTDGSDTASATVTIAVLNTAPEAYGTSEGVRHDQVLTSYLYGYDADADELTFSVMTPPAHGTLSLCLNGEFAYTPHAGYIGSDSFEFSVSDGLDSAIATVTIDVHNTAPEAYGGSANVLHDQVLTSYVSGYDPDEDSLTFSVASGPANGSLALAGDGSFTYTPNAGFVGSDSFGFSVSDGVATVLATFSIVVTNDAPIAQSGSASTDVDQPVSSSLNAWDPNGDPLTFSLSSSPTNGMVNINSDGTFDYMPNTGFIGTDSFVFQASDGVASATETFFVQVNAPNQAMPRIEVILESTIPGLPVGGMPTTRDGSLEGSTNIFSVRVILPPGVNALPNQVTADYQTYDGTAKDGVDANGNPVPGEDNDYARTVGTLTFPAGAQAAR